MGFRSMTPPSQKQKEQEQEQEQEQDKKVLPKWKREKLEKEEREKHLTPEKRSVNPMTMVPENASISGRAPLPPKAKQAKRLYGF